MLFVLIADAEGKVLAQQLKPQAKAIPDVAALALQHTVALATAVTTTSLHYHTLGTQSIYHVAAPVETTRGHIEPQRGRLATAMWLLSKNTATAGDGPAKTGKRGSVQLLLSLENMQASVRKTLVTGVGLTLGTILHRRARVVRFFATMSSRQCKPWPTLPPASLQGICRSGSRCKDATKSVCWP